MATDSVTVRYLVAESLKSGIWGPPRPPGSFPLDSHISLLVLRWVFLQYPFSALYKLSLPALLFLAVGDESDSLIVSEFVTLNSAAFKFLYYNWRALFLSASFQSDFLYINTPNDTHQYAKKRFAARQHLTPGRPISRNPPS